MLAGLAGYQLGCLDHSWAGWIQAGLSGYQLGWLDTSWPVVAPVVVPAVVPVVLLESVAGLIQQYRGPWWGRTVRFEQWVFTEIDGKPNFPST